MSKIQLLGFTRHTIAIHTAAGEQRIPLAEGQAVACFLVDGHTEDEAHAALRRMEMVANITPEQIRQLEEYSAPLHGELAQTEGPPAEGEQLGDQAAQPEVPAVAIETPAPAAHSDSEIGQTWGDH